MTGSNTFHQAQKLDPLRLPLQGRQVIEASAGTGKTWTLAALYLRLVLGHERESPLLPPQILVMTFTEAATAELRDRIRARLSQAAAYFDASAQHRTSPLGFVPDSFLTQLRDSYAPDAWPRCALQLHCAAEWMDEAAIYTIHGWSRRMLSQHALDSRHLFAQTHLENPQALQRTLTQDYWRTWFYPLSTPTLAHITPFIGNSPDAWLGTVQAIWKAQEKSPHASTPPAFTPTQVIAQHAAWQDQCDAHAAHTRNLWSEAVWDALQNAIAHKAIRGRGITAAHLEKWTHALKAWAEQGSEIKPDWLARFGTDALVDKGWTDARSFAFFAAVQDHVLLRHNEPDTHAQLAAHAAYAIGLAYQEAKTQRAAFDFSDLLQQLYNAVMADDVRLATAIRQQYPVALVDEFQDTDPWQYGTLHRIYDTHACTSVNALVMIGDPKQAIYSFRGADLGTYLQAREHAWACNPHALHTLNGNWRSTAGLVHAINHVFTRIETPFASAQGPIDFVRVQAEGNVPPLHPATGTLQPAMTVWHMPCEDKPTKTEVYLQDMSGVFASHMAELLNRGVARPGDMAVLVRNQRQAQAMQAALRACAIPSVYLSDRGNVYESPEATDLWRLLRAVASPRQPSWVRAAVGSPLWALSLDEVMHLTNDEEAWETLLDHFHHWHQLWQTQGVLPMLHHWLHGQGVAQRLLATSEGERRMSNLLHLGELLQQAAQSLQGEHALVRFLEEQIHAPTQRADAQKMRLETDAQCVQVVTYHKSKGLQYPLVFVPFAGSFKTDAASSSLPLDNEEDTVEMQEPSSVEEDTRLLYVALTRAQQALWMGLAEIHGDLSGDAAKNTLKQSALSRLLQRQARGDLGAQLHRLWGDCPDICISTMPDLPLTRYAAPALTDAPRDARQPQRVHDSLWWTASFSAISRGLVSESKREEALADALTDAQGVDTPTESTLAPVTAWQNFPAGARYGTLLHDLLEWLALNDWPLANPQSPNWANLAWDTLLERKTQLLQLEAPQRALLETWLQTVVHTPIALDALHAQPLTLSALSAAHMWPEMEFHLEVQHLHATQLDQCIQTYVSAGTPRPLLHNRVMRGMLTGAMDLVVQHDGRYWVVDYKSNKLSSYDAQSLENAVLEKRYDVQYVLYTLAVHRLLKARLPHYHYDHHMGGVIYLFLRGLDPHGSGVYTHKPSLSLIEALDALFANARSGHATDGTADK